MSDNLYITENDLSAIHDDVDGEINEIDLKAIPVGADILLGENSADNFSKIKIPVSGLAGVTDELVKVSVDDNAAGYVIGKFVIDNGVNAANPLTGTEQNPGGNETFRIRFDETKVDHDNLLNFLASEHFLQVAIDHTVILNRGGQTHAQIDAHIASVADPHNVTKTQVGLPNVTDDAQLKIASNLSDVNNQQTSLNNVSAVAGASNEEVLTKDTGTGNAAFKAPQYYNQGTYVIGSSDSVDNSGADAIITVTNDAGAIINTALSNYEKVVLLDGTYYIDTLITMNAGNVLHGLGHNTILRKDSNGSIITLNSLNNTIIRDLQLDGQSGSYTGDGITESGSTNCHYINVLIDDCQDDGFVGCSYLNNCYASNNSGDGFNSCNALVNCTGNSNTGNGFNGCNGLSNCASTSNTADGFQSCNRITAGYTAGNAQGYDSCQFVSSCYSNGDGRGFDECDFLSACTASSATVDFGYFDCEYVSACQAYDNNTDGFFECNHLTSCFANSNGVDGFEDCNGMSQNRSAWNTGDEYDNCFADRAGTVAVGTTAAGGWNAVN